MTADLPAARRLPPSDADSIVRALQDRAETMRRRARSRRWSGDKFARPRALMRLEANDCAALARRLEGAELLVREAS